MTPIEGNSMFFEMLFMILSSKITLTLLLIIYLSLMIADLFRRHLLSNSVVYNFTVLLSPLAFIVAVLSLVYSFMADNSFWYTSFTFIGSSALTVMAITVYIRGHIKPVDTSSAELSYANPELVKLAKIKRLIITGTAGMVIFGFVFVCALVIAIEYFVDLVIVSPLLLMCVIVLFIPYANIFAAFVLLIVGLFYGTIIACLSTACVIVMLMSFLVTNGCIRYILTTNKTKGQKALFIFLSFIPIYNVIYGIHSLLKTNEN